MERRISQETFDSAVKENIEEFDMPLIDAIADAMKQFLGQGVDLTNIDTSGGEGKEELMDAIRTVNAYAKDISSSTVEAVKEKLLQLATLCGDEHALCKRNQTLVLTEDCYNSLHYLLDEKFENDLISASLQLIGQICKTNVECRDFFEPGGSSKVSAIVRAHAELRDDIDVAMTISALKTARIVAKSENNKVALMKSGFGDHLIRILGTTGSNGSISNPNLIREACQLIRELCVHDDNRKETSCAYDNGRLFVGSVEVPRALMQAAANFTEQPQVAIAALGAARALITADDAVRALCSHGALSLPAAILRQPEASPSMVKAALGITRNLCADDIRKDTLVGDGTLAMIIRILSSASYFQDAGLVEHGIASLAAMSLRSPSNSARMMTLGVPPVLVKCMQTHSQRPALLRQACLTVRNIAARCPESRETFLDAGMENQLRAAGGRYREVVDEAYAALRDLGCDAKVVAVDETFGAVTVQEAFQQFGGGKKAQFNPVFEETADIVSRVASEARAPFASSSSTSSYRHIDDDDDDDDMVLTLSAAANTTTASVGHETVVSGDSHIISAEHNHSHDHDTCEAHQHTNDCDHCCESQTTTGESHEHQHHH